MAMEPFSVRHWITVATLLSLTGCATLSEDAGFGAVRDGAKSQLGKDVVWVRQDADRAAVAERVKALLAQPLDVDTAVQIALLNNPGLQAAYSELGIAEAARVQAGRLRNPGFSFSRLTREGVVEIERKFVFDLMGLLTMPVRSQIETRRFEQAKLAVTGEVLRVAAETRRAWFDAVAAAETVRYLGDVVTAAEAAAELARRMARVGNWSRLSQAREQAFYAEAVAQLARARQAEVAAREALTRLMGLWGEQIGYTLPERLPDLPGTPRPEADLEAAALEQRVDVQIARREVEGLAKSLGLTRATRFVNVLEGAYQHNSETGEPRQTGYEIELSIPLFDFGEARVAHAEALYLQAVNRLAETAVTARSQVREAYVAYRTHYDIARHYRDEIVPLRRQIAEETLLRYNGMLVGVFELLAEARQQVASVTDAIAALRDFWLAQTDLDAVMSGAAPRGVAVKPAVVPASAGTPGH